MNILDLENFLVKEEDDLEWASENNDLYIRSKKWNTCIKVELDKLDNIQEELLMKEITQGKNIVQITRVTGFFSNIKNWNPGKKGELKDRYRINNIKTE